MRKLFIFFSVFFCAALSHAQTPQEMRALSKANNDFAIKLYSQLARANSGRNIFFSPYGISMICSILYAGASSDTAKQIAENLSFSTDTKKLASAFEELRKSLDSYAQKQKEELLIANALWAQDNVKLNSEFAGFAQKFYGLEFFQSGTKDLESERNKINSWIRTKTENKIAEAMPERFLVKTTSMVLTNAIYFKGAWQNAFSKDSTKADKFYLSSSTFVNARMMYQEKNFPYIEKDGVQVLEIPYDSDEISMVVLLPVEPGGIKDLENNLTLEKLYWFSQGLWDQKIKLSFPKFKIKSKINLKPELEKIGVTDAFGPKADFMLMSETKGLFVSDVLHNAVLEVNEDGSEAAGATVVDIGPAAKREKVPEFKADRPFLFIIRENKYGSILLMGRVVDPSSANLKIQ